jgi:hypothetical protein
MRGYAPEASGLMVPMPRGGLFAQRRPFLLKRPYAGRQSESTR